MLFEIDEPLPCHCWMPFTVSYSVKSVLVDRSCRCTVSFTMRSVHGTVEPVLKDHPTGHKNVACQDKWSLVTGSVILTSRSFCQNCVVCQDRWSLMAVVSQDRFHCNKKYQCSLLNWCISWYSCNGGCIITRVDCVYMCIYSSDIITLWLLHSCVMMYSNA